MRTAITILTLIAAAGVGQAQQQMPTISELLTAELKAAQACDGVGDPAVIRGRLSFSRFTLSIGRCGSRSAAC